MKSEFDQSKEGFHNITLHFFSQLHKISSIESPWPTIERNKYIFKYL